MTPEVQSQTLFDNLKHVMLIWVYPGVNEKMLDVDYIIGELRNMKLGNSS